MFSADKVVSGPSPVGDGTTLDEKKFHPIDSDDEKMDEQSLDSLEALLPPLDPIDMETSDWDGTFMVPDAVGSFSWRGLAGIAESGTDIPTYSPMQGQGEDKATDLTTKPHGKILPSRKEHGPPTFIFPPEFTACYSPVKLPEEKVGFLINKTDGLVKPAAVVARQPPTLPVGTSTKKTNTTKDGRTLSNRRPRQAWNKQEDEELLALLKVSMKKSKENEKDGKRPQVNWFDISSNLTTATRTAKQCRDRWQNYLRPGITKGQWTDEEEVQIRELHAKFGTKWSVMSQHMKHRAENDIKNKWYSMQRVEKRRIAVKKGARKVAENKTAAAGPKDIVKLSKPQSAFAKKDPRKASTALSKPEPGDRATTSIETFVDQVLRAHGIDTSSSSVESMASGPGVNGDHSNL